MIIPFPRFLIVSFLLSMISLAPCGALNGIPAIYRFATSNPVSLRSLEKNFQRSTIKNQIMLRASLSTVNIDKAKPSPLAFPRILWRFTRPHTLVGSALAIPAIHALAAPSIKSFFSVTNFSAIIFAMLPALLMNLYITGLNQITDVDIDKINKPDLPIAAGDLHVNVAIFVVLVALVTSLWMGFVNPSQGLNVALWGSGILGTLYSLPPFRFKRFPLLAAFCISAVRGTIINAGFFSYAKHAAFGSESSSVIHYLLNDRACMLSSAFFGIFGIVIALMKDVPDVSGDESASVKTFPVRLGQKLIFDTSKNILTSLFFVVAASFIKSAFSDVKIMIKLMRAFVGTSAFVAGISVNKEATKVNPQDSSGVYEYYMHLWKLFYICYILLPLAR